MAEEEAKKVEPAPAPEPCSEAPPPEPVEAPPKDVAEEKSLIPPPAQDKPDDDCKPLAVVEKPEKIEEMKHEGSMGRDAELARLATEKRLSLIKAWEESEKSKAENKAQMKISSIAAWENSKKATLEAELKKIEEKLEKKKAEYIEKTKNKVALVHKAAEEKRAMTEARRGEDILKAEEIAAKYRATGTSPKKLLSFF
ncbi:remorin-like [Salvia miltiorrhiza]|uniref:remorin-like n=1 Tax=Salvia miltiorrhiza TaxID=226208 RepID=UPI0025AD6BEC|nr:remorin-like [Salvia miltiorrhiza]